MTKSICCNVWIFFFQRIRTHPQTQPRFIVSRTIIVHTCLFIKFFCIEEIRRVPYIVAFLYEYLAERHILYVLHHLAVKVGDVTTATQMVWVVVELHRLVCVALLEVILCSSRQSSCLRRFQAAVIAAETLAVHIVVVVLAIVRHCKGCLLFSILSVIFIFIF